MSKVLTSVDSLKDYPLDLPDRSRVDYFLHWVANKRARDPVIPRSEQLTCPMVWCEELFDEPARLVNHIQICKHISSYENYWCSYCQAEESFAWPSKKQRRCALKGAVDTISASCQRVSNILSNAADRRDRLKLLKGSKPPPRFSHGSLYELAGTELVSHNLISSDADEVDMLHNGMTTRLSVPAIGWSLNWEWHSSSRPFSEVAANNEVTGSEERVPFGETASRRTSLKESAMMRDTFASGKRFPERRHAITPGDKIVFELGGYPASFNNSRAIIDPSEPSGIDSHTPTSPRTLDSPVIETSSRKHSDMPYHDSNDINNAQRFGTSSSVSYDEPFELHTEMPYQVCDDQPEPSVQRMNILLSGNWPLSAFSSTSSESHDTDVRDDGRSMDICELSTQRLSTSVDRDCSLLSPGSMPAEGHSISSRDNMFQDQDVSFENVIEILRERHEQIIQRLSHPVVTPSVSLFLEDIPSNRALTRQGMTTFERFFSGHLPTSILEIFAMLHVAYAFALAIDYRQDIVRLQTDFYLDILCWGQAIHPTERAAFEEIAEHLCKPSPRYADTVGLHPHVTDSCASPSLGNNFINSSTLDSDLHLSQNNYFHSSSSAEEVAGLSRLNGEIGMAGLLDSLGKGKIIRSFARSLDSEFQ